jgi:hypothetical protein
VKGRLGLLPLPRRLGGVAGPRLPFAVLPGHLLVGLFGGRPGSLRLRLRLPQAAAALAERVEVIQLLGDGLLPFLAALVVDPGQAVLQPLAAVVYQVFQRGQLLQLFGPLLAIATWGQTAAQPAQALRLNDHQDGLLPEEDLIASALACPCPGVLVENLQHRPRAQGCLAAEAAQPGDGGAAIR